MYVRLFFLPLLSVDEAREENWIANEEDRSVVTHKIPNAFIGVEFQGKSAWIASCVSRATFTAL